MKLEVIEQNWQEDCHIDNTELANESARIPDLHQKYLKMYNAERLLFIRQEQDYKKLYRLKLEYYKGILDEKKLQELEWPQFKLRLTKDELSTYIDADQDISDQQLKMQYQKEKLNTLLEIIKSINARGYLIKNSIEWMRFTQGQG